MSLLHYALSFLAAIAALIAIHEFGHFIAARCCGVKVLRFSLGFGPQLFSCRLGADATEFSLAAIPLGGYVRMLDEREAPVSRGELSRAFNTQSLTRRSLIVLAGPLANIFLAILLSWGLTCAGTRDFPARLGSVPAGSLAAEAGLQTGDLIRRFAGEEVLSWSDLRWQLVQNALTDGLVVLDVQRGDLLLSALEMRISGLVIDEKAADPMRQVGLLLPSLLIKPVLSQPLPGSPAEAAGLQAHDLVLRLDGLEIKTWPAFVEQVSGSPGKELLVEVERSGQILELRVRPEPVPGGGGKARIGVAVEPDADYLRNNTIEVRRGVFSGLSYAIKQTWSTTRFSLEVMWRIATGRVSWRNVSGPVTIADYAGQSASAGLEAYLKFIAMVSISLGVLNLLPVPILDGGHLLYYAIEYIRGKPLSDQLEQLGQRMGMIILALLMSLAFFNDLNRVIFG